MAPSNCVLTLPSSAHLYAIPITQHMTLVPTYFPYGIYLVYGFTSICVNSG